MILAFESTTVRELCESSQAASSRLGEEAAHLLQHRLADIEAAPTPADLPEELRGIFSGREWLVKFAPRHRLVIEQNHNAYRGAAKLDWTRIRRVKIMRIEETHE